MEMFVDLSIVVSFLYSFNCFPFVFSFSVNIWQCNCISIACNLSDFVFANLLLRTTYPQHEMNRRTYEHMRYSQKLLHRMKLLKPKYLSKLWKMENMNGYDIPTIQTDNSIQFITIRHQDNHFSLILNFISVYWIFTKLGHMIPLWKGKNPIYFEVITIIPFDNLYRRAYFVMHTFRTTYPQHKMNRRPYEHMRYSQKLLQRMKLLKPKYLSKLWKMENIISVF
jgi:hypothetical protein